MDIKTIKVTPGMAADWLAANTTNNRKISRQLVQRYANDMILGKWEATGEAIKFDQDGRLIDGQHRLSAVVASKKTVDMLVITGLESQVIQVIDTGRSRSAGDALTIAGQVANANALAALARKVMGFKSGTEELFDSKKIRMRGQPITNRDIIAFCARVDLTPHINFSGRANYAQVAKVFTQGEWAFLHWLFSQRDAGQAEEFLMCLATLDGVGRSSPIRMLFEKIVRSSVKLDGKQKLSACIQAWNAWRRKETLLSIRVGRMEGSLPIAV